LVQFISYEENSVVNTAPESLKRYRL